MIISKPDRRGGGFECDISAGISAVDRPFKRSRLFPSGLQRRGATDQSRDDPRRNSCAHSPIYGQARGEELEGGDNMPQRASADRYESTGRSGSSIFGVKLSASSPSHQDFANLRRSFFPDPALSQAPLVPVGHSDPNRSERPSPLVMHRPSSGSAEEKSRALFPFSNSVPVRVFLELFH